MGDATPDDTTTQRYRRDTAKMGKGKPRGLLAARKLRNHRRDGKWADLHYKKRLLGTAFKSSPFGGSSHAKGIVLEKVGVEAKQPNSAIRKCVRVQLIKNGKKVSAFVPNDGCLNFVDENDRCSWPVSVVRARPRVIFPVCDSRSSRSRVSVSAPCGRRRRRSRVRRGGGLDSTAIWKEVILPPWRLR